MSKIHSVLIVDDSEIDHITIRYAIEDFDPTIEVTTVSDGQAALDTIASTTSPFDVILLDINMPGMNGHDFLTEYAKQPLPTTVIVMLTSSSQQDDMDRCYQYDFVKEFIGKPLYPESLKQIENIL
jgi:CheY-like chemotaxis protein